MQDSAVPQASLAPAILFLASALVGVWAAYDRGQAWPRFWGLATGLAAAGAIGWAGRRWGERALRIAGLGCAGLAAAVGLYFLLTHDWGGPAAGKFAALHRIGLWIQAHRPALGLTEDINGNVAGAALAILIPLGLAGAASRRGRRSAAAPLTSGLTSALIVIAAFALSLTASRGAWIGLIAGGAAAALAAGAGPRRGLALAWGLTLALAAASALVFAAPVALPGLERLLGGAGASAVGRAALWRDGLALAGDTPFTGAGLGSTMMVYSTYALMLHVGFIFHSHNLFLQIALEQGLPGLIAFAALIGAGLIGAIAGSRRERPAIRGPWLLAAAAALIALVVHGTVDAGLYVSRLAPVLFLPLGFAWAGTRGPAGQEAGRSQARSALTLASASALALAAALALLPAARAAFQANLAAVAQARAELGVYNWPQWPIQDALRRSAEVDLAPAVTRFEAARTLDPANAAANRRLGQIALSRGDEAAARRYLEAAHAAAPGQHVARRLLGESYAIAGEIGRAAALWRGLDVSQGQIPLREWWYAHLGQPDKAARIAAAAEAAQ